jgi:hypothetical protein
VLANEGRSNVLALGADKQTVVSLTPEQSAKWKTALEPITREWMAKTLGGEKALGTFRDLLAKVKAGS